MSDTEVLATVMPSPIRRFSGLAILAFLGGMLVYVALVTPPQSFGLQAMLLGLGGVILWLAVKMHKATQHGIELTKTELRTTDGLVLVRLEDVDSVVRGSFTMKPSNGFSVLTKVAQTRGWAPGLWWRVGKRVGVGGVTGAGHTRFMAEILAAQLARRGNIG